MESLMAEINPYAPPETDHVEPPPSEPPPLKPRAFAGEITRGARIAGACLIVNALLVFAEKIFVKDSGGGASVGIAPIIDLVIGGALAAGQGKYRTWALVRCVLGALVFGALSLSGGDMISFGLQLAVSGALIALLVGDPGLARTIVATVVFGLYVIVCVLGLVVLTSQGG
ncbi:MAG TPA: hypothetical protein VFF06_28540 [Polyangia bacterium]|nr:hypothetical protein [Polyangia bacterium]